MTLGASLLRFAEELDDALEQHTDGIADAKQGSRDSHLSMIAIGDSVSREASVVRRELDDFRRETWRQYEALEQRIDLLLRAQNIKPPNALKQPVKP